MGEKRKFEVHGENQNGDIWIVGTDHRGTAEHIAEQFKKDGYQNVRIVEN